MSPVDHRGPNPYQSDYDKCRFSNIINYKDKLNLNNFESYYDWTEMAPFTFPYKEKVVLSPKDKELLDTWGDGDRNNWCYDPSFGEIHVSEIPPFFCKRSEESPLPLKGLPVCLKHMRELANILWKTSETIPVTGLQVTKCHHKGQNVKNYISDCPCQNVSPMDISNDKSQQNTVHIKFDEEHKCYGSTCDCCADSDDSIYSCHF